MTLGPRAMILLGFVLIIIGIPLLLLATALFWFFFGAGVAHLAWGVTLVDHHHSNPFSSR